MVRFLPFLLLAGLLHAQDADNRPFPPFRIAGNVYYVGASDIASYLITTPAGHFILNSGYVETVPIIRDNVTKLGFKLEDIKIILNSQGHYDHVAGQADLQKLTGAKIYSSLRDGEVIASGGKKDPRFGTEHNYPPVKIDHYVGDQEKITLGDTTLTAHITPGHSLGCTTYTMQVTDGGKTFDVVFVGGTGVNPGVRLAGARPTWIGIAEDFALTFRVLRGLNCDIFLGAHGGYFDMRAKRERQIKGAKTNPFIDPQGYKAFIDVSEKAYLEQLARDKESKP